MRRATTGGSAGLFFHSDDQYNVALLTDVPGAGVEGVAYDEWGAPRAIDPATGAALAVHHSEPILE